MVTLVKEIGSDALFGLLRVLEGEPLERAQAFYEHCRDRRPRGGGRADRREGRPLARAARAARSRPLRARGRGARRRHRGARREVPHAASARTRTRSSCCPTRAMGPDDADYAVSFAVPVDTRRACRSTSRPTARATTTRSSSRCRRSTRCSRRSPCSTTCSCPGSACSCAGEPELAGAVSIAFVEYHRFTAVSYKLPLLDALVGTAALDRRDERRGQGRPHPRQAHPARSSTPRRCARSPTWPRSGAPRRRPRHRLPRPAHHQPGQVHVRHQLPRGAGAGAGLRRRAAGHRSGRRRLGQPRGARGAGEVLRRQGARPRSGSR